MNTAQYLAVGIGGLIAGVLNVAAAGGNTASFLILRAIGLPPAVANVTNLVATPFAFLGSLPSAIRNWRVFVRYWYLFLAAIAGTLTGYKLFLILPTARFTDLTPGLLTVAALALMVQPTIQRHTKHGDRPRRNRPVWMVLGIFATSTYAGFFGSGVGIMVLLVLSMTTVWPWLESNDMKNLVCLTTSAIGLGAYAFTDLVNLPVAALLGGTMFLGGLIGGKVTTKLDPDDARDLLRPMVVGATCFGAGFALAT